MQKYRGDLPDQPDQTLGGSVLASLQFVQDKILQGLGLSRSSQHTILNFLL